MSPEPPNLRQDTYKNRLGNYTRPIEVFNRVNP